MTFSSFLFVAVVWMPNGSPQPPVARLEVSLEACMADADEFERDINTENSTESPATALTFDTECHHIYNKSATKDS